MNNLRISYVYLQTLCMLLACSSAVSCSAALGCILVGQLSGSTLLHSRTFEQELVSKLQKLPDDEHYIEITTPDRFYTEHCSSVHALACLLNGARFDND